MAQIANPKKAFNFGIIAAGLNPYSAQEVNVPDYELDVVEHGDTNHKIKTAGMMNFGNVTITKLRPMGQADNWIWTWIQLIQNVYTGGGALASVYKRDLDIVQYGYDNLTVTDRWEIEGAWPVRINNMALSRTTSENSMETVELSVDRSRKVQ